MSDQEMDSPGRGLWEVVKWIGWILACFAFTAGLVWVIITDNPVAVIREQVLHLPSPTPTVTETPWPTETPEPTWTPEPTAAPTSDGRPEADAYRATIREALDHLTWSSSILDGLNADGHPGDDSWDSLLEGARRDWQVARTMIINTWPPGPYDASNPLLDSQARALMAVCNLDLALDHFEADNYNQGFYRSAIRGILNEVNENIQSAQIGLDW